MDNQPQQPKEHRREKDAWVGGAILLILGIVFLLQNTGVYTLNNWWALFILLPAIGAFANAWRSYQASGHFSSQVRSSIIGGLVLTLVAAVFLFDLSWSLFGPVLLILGGLAILVSAFIP
jgi:hypothetical protein